jgi:hypothetical protein
MSMKNIKNAIENQTRILPAYSAVPHPLPYRIPQNVIVSGIYKQHQKHNANFWRLKNQYYLFLNWVPAAE